MLHSHLLKIPTRQLDNAEMPRPGFPFDFHPTFESNARPENYFNLEKRGPFRSSPLGAMRSFSRPGRARVPDPTGRGCNANRGHNPPSARGRLAARLAAPANSEPADSADR